MERLSDESISSSDRLQIGRVRRPASLSAMRDVMSGANSRILAPLRKSA
jgi:hypothetical protein